MTSILTPSEAKHALQCADLSDSNIEFINERIRAGIADAVGHDSATIYILFSSTSKDELSPSLKPAVRVRMEQAGYEFIPKESDSSCLTFRAYLDNGISLADVTKARVERYYNLKGEVERSCREMANYIENLEIKDD